MCGPPPAPPTRSASRSAAGRCRDSHLKSPAWWKTSEVQPFCCAAVSRSRSTARTSIVSPKYAPWFLPSRCMGNFRQRAAKDAKVLSSLRLLPTLREASPGQHGFRFATRIATAAAFLLIAEAMLVPARIEAEVLEHLQILFDRLIERGEIIADHQRAGAGQEDHALRVTQVHGAASGDHDFLPRQNETEARDGLQNLQDRQRRIVFKRRAFDGVENVDRHDVCADLPEGKCEVAPVFARLAQADNTAGTNLDARLFQIADGFEAVVVSVGRARLREKASRAFEVVAVTFQAGVLQAIGDLLAPDDTQRGVGAGLAARFQFADAVAHFIEHGPLLQSLPGGDQTPGGNAVL